MTLPAGRSIPATGQLHGDGGRDRRRGGSYFNTLPAGALQTSNGNNAAPAVATLTVGGIGVVLPIVPTLSEWAMIALTALLALVGVAEIRRHAM